MYAEFDQELRVTCAAQPETKPLAAQKASADAHLQKVAKQHGATVTKLEKTQEQFERMKLQLAE